MTAYIIAFSIVTACLLAATVALCLLYVRSVKRGAVKRSAQPEEMRNTFTEVYGTGRSAAFLLVDTESGQPVFVSPNIESFLGVSAEEIFCDTESATKMLDRQCVRSFTYGYAQWDKTGIFGREFKYASDKHAKIEAYISEIDGKTYTAFTITDITEFKNVQAQMQEQLESALEQAVSKSTFLSSMSHEIRTPMNGVMGMISLARKNINDAEKATNYLERAGDLSVFLLSMINDILDISKIESGKMQLYNTDFDIFAFAEKIRNMFNGTVTGKGIAFNVETVDFTARYFVGDELRLTQVVTNFVSNANKFTPVGGKIEVTFKQLDIFDGRAQIMIRVRDTGKGIAPENIRKIFRPFEQEEASTTHKYGGTGLGLAICDQIVNLMGGNIVVDSELGKGTDFSVFISLSVSNVTQDLSQPIAEEKSVQEIDFTFDGCRILLAEDNEINAEIAVDILEGEGAIVTHARDGREAVETFENTAADSFDLILMDIQMPRLNGRDAAREIRKSSKADALRVPIIALSADAFVEDIKRSEEAGMDGHVSKPIDFDELRKRSGEIITAKKGENGTSPPKAKGKCNEKK